MMELWGIVKLTGCTIRINAEILKMFFSLLRLWSSWSFYPVNICSLNKISPQILATWYGHLWIQQNDSCVSLGQYCNFAQYLYSLQEV